MSKELKGEFYQGFRLKKGSIKGKNGFYHEGEFGKDGEFLRGFCRNSAGNVMKGEWKNGAFWKGKRFRVDGTVDIGEFVPNGEILQGETIENGVDQEGVLDQEEKVIYERMKVL